MNITKIITIAATVATLALGTSAQAQTVPTIELDTSAVDFSNPAAVDQLKLRIARAAKDVCPFGDERDLKARSLARQCFKDAVSTASSKIDLRVAQAAASRQVLASNTTTGD